MSLITQSIQDLLGGVSQRDERLRQPNEAETQENCLTDPAHGLMKRPPAVFDAQFSSNPAAWNTNPFTHTIARLPDEKFRMVIRNDSLKVFKISDGSEVTIHTPEGTAYLNGQNYRALTLGNTTFICNRDTVVDTLDDEKAQRDPEALVFVRQGDFSSYYSIEIGSYEFSYITPAANDAQARSEIETNEIARQLHNGLLNQDDFDSTFDSIRTGSSIYFTRSDNEEFKVNVRDGLADKGLLAVKDSVQRVEDLPLRATDGFTVEITGDADTPYDNHWVVYDEAENPEDAGVWRETVKPGTKTKLDPDTMPHELVLRGGISDRGESRGAPADPIIRNVKWQNDEHEWEDKTDDSGTTSIPSGEESTIEGHNDDFSRDVPATNEGEETRVEARFGIDASQIEPNEGVRLSLQIDDGQGTYTTIAEKEVLSGDVIRAGSLAATTTPATGSKIRLRQEYLSGETPSDTYRRARTVAIHESTPNETIKDERDFVIKKKPLELGYFKATGVAFGTDREYPGSYQIRVTVGADNFDYTPSSTETGDTVAAALQALIDADASWEAKVVNSSEIWIKDASDGQPAPTVSVTQTFDEDTHLWLKDTLNLSGVSGVDGAEVLNITDGSTGTIQSHTDDTVVVDDLAGGVDNAFEKGDLIKIEETGDYFVFRPSKWRPREVGDLETNDFPEFVGTAIQDIFFYQGRLGFAFSDEIHVSAAGDILNLHRQTAAQVLADDSFGAQAASSVETSFHSTIPWQRELYLVSENGLTLASGNPVLTPSTIRMDFVAQYENSADIRPVAVGDALFMTQTTPQGTKVFEVRKQGVDDDGTPILRRFNLTRDIPTYIEGTPMYMTGSDALGFLGLLTEDSSGNTFMYVYRWLDGARSRIVSSWSEWTFDDLAKLRGMDIVDGILGLIVQHNEDVCVEELDLIQDPNAAIQKVAYLDRRVTDSEATPVLAGGDTTWTLPFDIATDGSEGTIRIFRTDTMAEITGLTRPATDQVTKAGEDHTATPVYIGLTYTQTYTPTTPFRLRDQQGGSMLTGDLRTRQVFIRYHDSTDGVFTSTPEGRTGETVTLDADSPEDGDIRLTVMAQEYTITITNSTPGSLNLSSIDFEGSYSSRFRRR